MVKKQLNILMKLKESVVSAPNKSESEKMDRFRQTLSLDDTNHSTGKFENK